MRPETEGHDLKGNIWNDRSKFCHFVQLFIHYLVVTDTTPESRLVYQRPEGRRRLPCQYLLPLEASRHPLIEDVIRNSRQDSPNDRSRIFLSLEHPGNYTRLVRGYPRGLDLKANERADRQILVPMPPALLLRLAGQRHQMGEQWIDHAVESTQVTHIPEARRACSRLDTADLRWRAEQLLGDIVDREASLLAEVTELACQFPTPESWTAIIHQVTSPAHLVVTVRLLGVRAPDGHT